MTDRASRVEARAAATVVLMRPGPNGPEVLLGRRPSSMAFAPDVHVFPGGRVDPSDAHPSLIARSVISPEDAAAALGGDLSPVDAIAAYIAAIRESWEEAGVLFASARGADRRTIDGARTALVGGDVGFAVLAGHLDLTLHTDRLVPLSRWVTPPIYPRRFDARFFVAELPDGASATLEGDEVVEQDWRRPADALAAMADGTFDLWLPTSTTLQQLEHVDGLETVRERLAPGPLGEIEVDLVAPDVVRIEMPAGGGIAGQPVNAYLVGRRRFVLVDPGDPTGPALDRALTEATARGGEIVAIALTHADPDHAAGAEALAERLGIGVHAGPGGGRPLPHDVVELADGDVVELGDIPLRVVATPGPRADHVAFLIGDGGAVLTGDLDGTRGARSVFGPTDDAAWAASRRRLDALVGEEIRLPGHRPRD